MKANRRNPRARLLMRALAWGLITFLTIPNSVAASQPLADLLAKLNLSDYPRGDRPPAFSGRTYSGQRVSLSSLKGNVVLLNFWATWCNECRPEMPVFENLHRDFASRGLAVIGVNVREGEVAIHRYADDLGLTFPLVTDSRGKITDSYGVIGVPTTFLIGRDGRAVGLAVGPRNWDGIEARDLIEALLTEPPPGIERQ